MHSHSIRCGRKPTLKAEDILPEPANILRMKNIILVVELLGNLLLDVKTGDPDTDPDDISCLHSSMCHHLL